MFQINAGKGFTLKFDNGWEVSVQFGPGNYCSNRDVAMSLPGEIARNGGNWQSWTAEVAVFGPGPGDDDPIKGWRPADEIAEIITEVAAR